MCDDETFGECMKANTFGFSSAGSHVANLKLLEPGAKAFLFHVKKRVLFGPFMVEAVVPPDERDRELWGRANGKYPNQVRWRSDARSDNCMSHRRSAHRLCSCLGPSRFLSLLT